MWTSVYWHILICGVFISWISQVYFVNVLYHVYISILISSFIYNDREFKHQYHIQAVTAQTNFSFPPLLTTENTCPAVRHTHSHTPCALIHHAPHSVHGQCYWSEPEAYRCLFTWAASVSVTRTWWFIYTQQYPMNHTQGYTLARFAA